MCWSNVILRIWVFSTLECLYFLSFLHSYSITLGKIKLQMESNLLFLDTASCKNMKYTNFQKGKYLAIYELFRPQNEGKKLITPPDSMGHATFCQGTFCRGCYQKLLCYCFYRLQRNSGTRSPSGSACGTKLRKSFTWKRDKASAILFSQPGICLGENATLFFKHCRSKIWEAS